ncbi:hypothetical protein F4818DRAFT_441337 [Hypoxylon cercidicola]|nr:hypothetical protein F4818DRAFT_441337 [Hypoxylon cercidicola]
MGKFVLLDNDRFDMPDENVTILGSTLFSFPPAEDRDHIDDFYRSRGGKWDYLKHLSAFRECVGFLQRAIDAIIQEDPTRSIVILTHHCPSQDPKVLPTRPESDVEDYDHYDPASLLSTDMTRFTLWHMPQLKSWGFGGTGFNCDIYSPSLDLQLCTNQGKATSPEGPRSSPVSNPSIIIDSSLSLRRSKFKTRKQLETPTEKNWSYDKWRRRITQL